MRFLAALLASVIALSTSLVIDAKPAFACSMLEIPDPHERLEPRLEEWSDLIVLGRVVSETPIETAFLTSPTGASFIITPLDKPPSDPEGAVYQSTVHVDAVLKGALSQPDLVLPVLSDVWQCGGGPRLHPGDTVLLLLIEEPTWTSFGEPRDVIWAAGPAGGNVRFEGGQAYLDDYQSELGNELGDAIALINYVADRVDASNASRDAALAALSAPIPNESGGFDWPLLVASLVIVAAAAISLLLLRRSNARRV